MNAQRETRSAEAARFVDRATAWWRRLSGSTDPRPSTHRHRRKAVVGGLIVGLILPVAASAPTPVAASGAIQNISFEAVNNDYVQLGSLASRTQRKPLDVSGIGPYTVRGSDSSTSLEYSFVTDQFYDGSNVSHGAAWTREGDERVRRDVNGGTWTSNSAASYLERSGVLMLKQNVNCASGNTFDGLTTYCTIFGPDVFTEAFQATAGQAVSFDWAAKRISDDYEVYAFLVAVNETSPGVYDYGSPATHTILAHGRGNTQPWTTSSREITQAGTYRFRFVNGSYDQTGGYALGSEMYIDSVVKLGTANPIDFAPLSDKVTGAAPFTVSATAPGGTVMFSTATTDICTVSGTEVTLTGTLGVCTIVADQAGDSTNGYVPAESVARSFTVLANATAPSNSGAPYISGTVAEGSLVTGNDGTWGDGGSEITSTTRQWRVTNGGTTTDIAGKTSNSCIVVASPGSQISFAVTKTNSIGSTTVASALAATGYTCGDPIAPAWTDDVLSSTFEVGASYSNGVSATGAPAPTYSISAGQLPAGLSLNPSSGALTGTPTTAGPFSFTITATNGFGTPLTVTLSGTVTPAISAPTWADNTALGDLDNGTPVTKNLSAVGYPAVTYSVTAGQLPAGLTLDAATGVVSGTPTGSGPYDFTITAANGIGGPVTRQFVGVVNKAVTTAVTAGFTAVDPVRVRDTRSGAPLAAGTVHTLDIASSWGLPADATAMTVNLTVTDPAAAGFLTAYPCGSTVPNVSNLNFVAGQAVANMAVVALDASKQLCVFSTAATHLIVDLNGYHSNERGDRLSTRTPTRPIDTRPTAKLSAGDIVTIPVAAAGSASAAVLNVTVTQPDAAGFVTMFPCGTTVPNVSNLNFVAGQTVANHANVKLSAEGTACLYTSVATHVIVDLSGTFSDDGTSVLAAKVPDRMLDTRSTAVLPAGSTQTFTMVGGGAAPAGTTALALNVTVTGAQAPGYVTVFPCGDLPATSNVNYTTGHDVANHVTAQVDADGKVCVYSSAAIHLVIDVQGTYGMAIG